MSYSVDHPVNKKFVDGIFDRHPLLSGALRKDWIRVEREQDYRGANIRLRGIHGRLTLGDTGLFMDSPDHVVKSFCEKKSQQIQRDLSDFAARKQLDMAIDYAVKAVEGCGLDFPLEDTVDYKPDDMYGALARVIDAKWWRGQVRKLQAREVERVARDIRIVHAKAGIYCSDYTVARRKEQKSRNRDLLEAIEAVNDDGYCATLAELSDLSVSNPVNRRNELMTRIRGFEELAQCAGHTGVFLTLTCPSKYHAMSYSKKTGATWANKKYNGSSPRDAQKYLCSVLDRVRAKWARNEIKPYGFRVVEPHHDGTPHWHLMLFIQPEQKNQLIEIFKYYALLDDGDERGAAENRTDVVEIDPAVGSAAGYIAKYISKNIDGYGIDADLYGREAKESARRIEAWATTWGIRQFQQIGGASVTVWRELRRIESEDLSGADDMVKKVRNAADEADWAAFTMLMGGVQVKRVDQLLRPMYVEKEEPNDYGEIGEMLKGLVHKAGSFITRIYDWTLQKAGTQEKESNVNRFSMGDSKAAKRIDMSNRFGEPVRAYRSFYIGTRSGSTWTCVNNCTEYEFDPPDDGLLLY